MPHAHELMRTDYILADVDDTVAELIGQMVRHDQCYATVFDGKTYKGMVAKKWLLSSRIDPATMKIRNLMTHRSKSKTPFFVPKLAPDTDLREMARLFATADVHALPVIVAEKKQEKVLGVVHSADLIRELRSAYAGVRVDRLASMKLITIDQDEELGKALNIMSKQGIGRVVVVDAAKKLIGIISLTDIITDVHSLPRTNVHVSKAASHQKGKKTGFGMGEKDSILSLPVHNILTHIPDCCTLPATGTVSEAIEEMAEKDVSSIVLVKGAVPVGILTAKDILEDYAKE